MKVYITKYALTHGIDEYDDAIVCTDINVKMISVQKKGYKYHFHKPHWHETKEEAIAQAEKMRQKKIASLKKQIVKLENLKF